MSKKIVTVLNLEPSSIVENDIAAKLALEWHRTFCPSLLEWAKQRPKRGYRWERVISEEANEEALHQYSLQLARTYFIMPERFGYNESVIYQTSEKPDASMCKRVDLYVFPKNMAWSMAFTHESGWLGPYFSRNKDYVRLQKINIQSVNAKAEHG